MIIAPLIKQVPKIEMIGKKRIVRLFIAYNLGYKSKGHSWEYHGKGRFLGLFSRNIPIIRIRNP